MLTRKRKGNKKQCKGIRHAELTLEKPQKRLHTVTSRDYSKRALNYVKEQKLFGNESSYVCDVCIGYALGKLDGSEQNNHDVVNSINNSAVEVMNEAELEGVTALLLVHSMVCLNLKQNRRTMKKVPEERKWSRLLIAFLEVWQSLIL